MSFIVVEFQSFLTTNAIDASKRTQGFESHKIMERFFPFHTQQGLAYAFFHANDNSSILDVPCLEEFSLQFQTSIERYEADNKVQLLHTPLMGYYLSDNMLMQASTISMNGHSTIILIEFEHVEKKLSQDYEVLHKMFDSEYKSACSPAERAQLSAGLLGMSEFNRDAKNSLNFILNSTSYRHLF
ncbi:hypothetical protein BLNAU_17870 [Blattamonas nauphoetae]|uniref:Uncharacterized protein n=1 Tax=Blattamonas nauphoetae TaxID=2049346 RepID=A0ABQ9X638_9EUKA|nr:hypothetical protein BLNAU_17870 [Blattamonas nauphoetae]